MRNKNILYIIVGFAVFTFSISCISQTETPSPEVLAAGKKVYEANCLVCHQKDGSGVPRLNAPLIKSKIVQGDKKKLIRLILLGSEKAGIRNDAYSNPMPAQPQLTDAEIATVLTYVRNSFGNKATSISAAEVKHIRKK